MALLSVGLLLASWCLWVGASAAPQKPKAPEKQKSRVSISVSYLPPRTLEEMWDKSDAVAMVKVIGGRPVVKGGLGPLGTRVSVTTDHDVDVLEVFKDRTGLLQGKERQRVSQAAGVGETEDKIYENEEVPFPPGTQWILFVRRTGDSWVPVAGPFGAFRIGHGKVTGLLGYVEDDTPVENFTALLKSYSSRY